MFWLFNSKLRPILYHRAVESWIGDLYYQKLRKMLYFHAVSLFFISVADFKLDEENDFFTPKTLAQIKSCNNKIWMTFFAVMVFQTKVSLVDLGLWKRAILQHGNFNIWVYVSSSSEFHSDLAHVSRPA